jgi:hypothetical protein
MLGGISITTSSEQVERRLDPALGEPVEQGLDHLYVGLRHGARTIRLG